MHHHPTLYQFDHTLDSQTMCALYYRQIRSRVSVISRVLFTCVFLRLHIACYLFRLTIVRLLYILFSEYATWLFVQVSALPHCDLNTSTGAWLTARTLSAVYQYVAYCPTTLTSRRDNSRPASYSHIVNSPSKKQALLLPYEEETKLIEYIVAISVDWSALKKYYLLQKYQIKESVFILITKWLQTNSSTAVSLYKTNRLWLESSFQRHRK